MKWIKVWATIVALAELPFVYPELYYRVTHPLRGYVSREGHPLATIGQTFQNDADSNMTLEREVAPTVRLS